jgi:ribonuclease BN (tRNA processing enzyme)
LGLTVTVLGSAAMYASAERAASGYLIELDDARLWLDGGGGTWQNLQRCCDHKSITGILLTHRHPDHVIDVFQAFHARAYGGPEPLDTIPLWAPQETLDHLDGFSSDITKSFDPIALTEESVLEIASARLTFTSMAHPVTTLGVRIETDSGVLAYSADTGPGCDLRRLAEDADVFICEATFQDADEEWEGHMRASQAMVAAAEVGARSLVLTHLPHERDLELSLKEARAAGDVEVSLAQDLRRIEVGR